MTVTVDLDHRPPLTFYLSVGLVAGSIIALQIGIMRVFSVGSWAHFGSLVVSLAMFGFGLTSAVMCVGKGWFERHWLGADQGRAAGLRAADGGVQPRRPAGAVQRHLPGLRPDAEVAAVRQLRALLPAVPGRRALSRRRLPEGAEDLQPRLLRRPRRLGPVRALRAARHVLLPPRRPHHGAAAAVAGRRRAVVRGAGRPARHRRHRHRRRSCRPSCTTWRRRCSASPSSRCRTTRACPTPASSPTTSAPTSAPRRSATWRSTRARTCTSRRASRTTPRSTCRPCRRTPISASTSTPRARRASSRTCRPSETAYFKYLSMFYPYVLKQNPDTFVVQFGGGISTAVALKAGSAHVTVAEGNPAILTAFREDKGLRDFTGDILQQSQGHRHRLRRPPLRRPYQEPLRRHRPVAGQFGRPVEPRRLLHRREVLLYPRGDERLHAGAEAGRHPVGHAVEQGRAAQVGAEALRHHGGRGARRRRRRHRQEFLRRLVLSLDRDRAVQARRLHAGRDRQAQRPHQGDVVRRDLLSRHQGRHGRAEADPAGLSRPVLLRGHAGRSDGAVGEGAQRQAAARHDHDRRRRQDRSQGRGARRRRACRPPCSAGWPGTT